MLKIEFKTGNAAFRNEDEELDVYAVADFLKNKSNEIAEQIECGYEKGSLIDINGNKVGDWELDD